MLPDGRRIQKQVKAYIILDNYCSQDTQVTVKELPDNKSRIKENPLELLTKVEKIMHVPRKVVYPTLALFEKRKKRIVSFEVAKHAIEISQSAKKAEVIKHLETFHKKAGIWFLGCGKIKNGYYKRQKSSRRFH